MPYKANYQQFYSNTPYHVHVGMLGLNTAQSKQSPHLPASTKLMLTSLYEYTHKAAFDDLENNHRNNGRKI